MKFFHSIRWRLELWHGLVLTLVLAGFGFTAWRLQRATQFQRVDQELEQRISAIAGLMRRGGEAPDRPPPDRPPPPDRSAFGNLAPPPLEARLSPRDASLFEGTPETAFYYVVWQRDGREGSRSATAPPDAARPERGAQARDARLRGTLRERFHFLPPGDCILVGRNIRDELAGIRHFAWLLAGAGAVVLALGLAGGWWVSTRALRPIGDISATAVNIAKGDLTQRIHTDDAGSELGSLAGVLNETFARLQASFARQAQFTADASHELRTPVSVVLTQTQTALARERPAAEYRESLAACQRAAQRMRRLTESLLTLARLDSGEAATTREPCDLDRIACDAIELLQPIAQEQKVTLEVKSVPTRCEGNMEQLGQVVTNLVSNAISYNRPGGRVQVKVFAEAGAAVLAVSDTGEGITPEDLPHVFERFYRADKARSSTGGRTGLGLAITKAIVEAHGGAIEVATGLGKGTTFTVRLAGLLDPPGTVRSPETV
jgi:two-component system, OmpR family, sensor kinase